MRIYDLKEMEAIIFELKNNKCAIVPTDTVMGIVGMDEKLIYHIKKRVRSKKLILFVCNHDLLNNLSPLQEKFLYKFWPGATTIVMHGKSFRMPDSIPLLKIISRTGPLFSSSANISGEPPILSDEDAVTKFSEYIWDLIIVKGKQKTEKASTIIDIDNWKILRKGDNIDEIEKFFTLNQIKKQND